MKTGISKRGKEAGYSPICTVSIVVTMSEIATMSEVVHMNKGWRSGRGRMGVVLTVWGETERSTNVTFADWP